MLIVHMNFVRLVFVAAIDYENIFTTNTHDLPNLKYCFPIDTWWCSCTTPIISLQVVATVAFTPV